jgi:cyanophycin synthetase
MFPPGDDGRIPVVAVVGGRTATRHLSAILAAAVSPVFLASPGRQPGDGRHDEPTLSPGLRPGLAAAGCRAGSASAEAIVVGQRCWTPPAGTPQQRAGIVLHNPTIDAAILETSPRELFDAGFGNDRCDVAIVLDPQATDDAPKADAAGEESGVPTGGFMQALRHALGRDGVFVLPAEKEPAGIEGHLPAAQMILVGCQAAHPRVRAHLAAGGRAMLLQGDVLAWAQGAEPPVVLARRPPSVAGPETRGLLAALAAGLVLKYNSETLRYYLGSLP